MAIENFSLEHLSAFQQIIGGLTEIKVSIYDGKGLPILMPSVEDPVLALTAGSKTGDAEYKKFIADTISTAVFRKEITISKASTGQHCFFIPYHINGKSLILVGGAFFLSLNDFNEFISKSAYKYRISDQKIKLLSKKIMIMDYEKIQKVSLYIQKLFILFVEDGHENKLYRGRYDKSKIILRLLSNLEENISQAGIYALIADMLLFLFNADSLSFMADDGSMFKPVYAAGRLKEHIEGVNFIKSSLIVSEVIGNKHPVYSDDPLDIRSMGLAEQIESVHLFPVFTKRNEIQLLCLFNTASSHEDEDEISEMYKLANSIADTVLMQNHYQDKMKEIDTLNIATTELNIIFNKAEMLHASIVDTAVSLSKAERGSLMLRDNGGGELSIKAVHGVNKWLLKDLKVKHGEGIAGKVLRENIPIISSDIEKDFSIRKKPSYKTSSFMSIPLKIGNETIGVLNVSDKITGEVFKKEDLAMVHNFANYASMALKGSTYYTLAEHMKELSITDPLTSLYNRRYFQERLAEEIDRSERYNLKTSLCMLDIDDFKLFNDCEGHLAGDDLLRKLSRLTSYSLRVIDVLARIGGDEFAVIMPQTDKDEAYFVAERICNTIKQKLLPEWEFYPKKNITVSIGISTLPVDGNNPKKLLGNADKALYRAKMHGKNKIFIWEEQSEI